jgi:DNA-directed RNA polymerase subunit RPC12/RpoP
MEKVKHCIVCGEKHYREFDEYFCSKECKKKWDDKHKFDKEHTETSDDGAICPFCHEEHKAYNHGKLYDEYLTEYKCENCGKKFSVTVSCKYSWETKPRDEDYESIVAEEESKMTTIAENEKEK